MESLAAADALEIRSFRVVFSLERRLFAIDSIRLPVPHGVPVRGIVYFLGLVALAALAGRLPAVGALVELAPPPIRFLLAPGLLSAALVRARPDGRPAHRFLVAWARARLQRRRLDAFAPVPACGARVVLDEPIALLPDGRQAGLRPGAVRGPARVLVRAPVHLEPRGRRLRATSDPQGRPRVISLRARQVLELR